MELEIKLEDQTLEVDAPMFEPPFTVTTVMVYCTKLFLEKRKALSTWVDHGILIEDPQCTFNLLEFLSHCSIWKRAKFSITSRTAASPSFPWRG